MEIFLLRHGEAQTYAPQDQHRELSPQGRIDLEGILEQACQELQGVQALWHSPYVRTTQTKDVALKFLPQLQEDNCKPLEYLVPDSNYKSLYQWMQGIEQTSILLVTHQPLVGVFFDDLCGFESGRYRLGTSALAAIDADLPAAGMGHLRWLKQPS